MQGKGISGVWGFARVTTYSTGGNPPGTTLQSALLVNSEIHLALSRDAANVPPIGCSFAPNPVATATTDAEGVFVMAAPAGAYVLEACAGHADSAGIVSGPAEVTPGFTEQDLDFNDVPQ